MFYQLLKKNKIMTQLPQEIIYKCFRYLSYADLYNFIYQNKFNRNYFDTELFSRLSMKINFIHKNFPLILIELFTIQELLNAPILTWQQQFMGHTDYIDRINPEDIDSPIAIGIDCYNRSFICLKLTNLSKNEIFVCTLFQRYSDYQSRWTHGCHSYANFMLECGYFLVENRFCHKNFEENMTKLLSKKKCTLRLINNTEQDYILGY